MHGNNACCLHAREHDDNRSSLMNEDPCMVSVDLQIKD